MEPELVLDELIRQQTNSPGSARRSLCSPLPLRRTPARHYYPSKARSVAEIDPVLRDRIRGLVKGDLPWPLVILGEPGLGKSCAGLALVDHAGGFFYTSDDLAAEVIQANQGRLRTDKGRAVHPEELWDAINKAALVVIDELGVGVASEAKARGEARVSDHHFRCVKKVLDLREARPLVLISNLEIVQLALLYDDRLADRLTPGTVVRVTGESRRRLAGRTPLEAGGEPKKGDRPS